LTAGISHELIANLAVGVDYIFRKYDLGTQSYTIGYEPGAAGYPVSSIYEPKSWTDAATGETATYWQVKQGLVRPSGPSITMTNPDYQNYSGVDLTLNKRYSNKWQANIAVTLQKRADYDVYYTNPTGVELFGTGQNTGVRYLIKVNGSYDLPWGIMFSTNFNLNDGPNRNLSINGPGDVFGGVGQTQLDYSTLNFQPGGTTRLEKQMLWDFGVNKTFTFRGGQNRIKATIDGFNILNSSTVLSYNSSNISSAGSATNPTPPSQRISSIIPPRVIRAGITIWF